MSKIDKAAEVIRRARMDAPRVRGMEDTVSPHVARSLADAGLLAGDRPEPSFYAHGDQDKPMWDTGNHFRADALDAPQVALSKAGNVWKMNPDEARDLALALLAAAEHAETEDTDD